MPLADISSALCANPAPFFGAKLTLEKISERRGIKCIPRKLFIPPQPPICIGLSRMNKKDLTEADIRIKFITPALVGAHGEKWNVMTQIREEAYFTKGRVMVRGKSVNRGEAKKADYILSPRSLRSTAR
jgi:hypothetical protein